MSARDVVVAVDPHALAKALYERCPHRGWARGRFEELSDVLQAERITAAQNDIARLTAAGYRIVPPGGLDAAIEALEWYKQQVGDCAKLGQDGDTARQALDRDVGKQAAAALRSLIEEPDAIAQRNGGKT